MTRLALAFLLAALLLVGCSPANCMPGSCATGMHCVYVDQETTPACRPACELDGGTCASGTTCVCGGTCPGCKNCVSVCR